jgi:hypothetical protein
MGITSQIVSTNQSFAVIRPCAQIHYVLSIPQLLRYYPECQAYVDGDNKALAIITPNFNSEDNPMEITASLAVGFGAAGWVALWLHAVAMEIYVSRWVTSQSITFADSHVKIRLTPAESERLRQISYERQLERGFKHPGSAGLVTQRLGDANPWEPKVVDH